MNEARDALQALARAVSSFLSYASGHPARERAVDAVMERLVRLQEVSPTPTFSFLEGAVVFDSHPLRDLADWPWVERLSGVGVQRIEFTGPVERDDLLNFIDDLARRLGNRGADAAESRVTRPTRIRYGLLQREGPAGDGENDDVPVDVPEFDLEVEAQTLQFLEVELRGRGNLHLAEAEAVVASLLQAMHTDRQMLLPLTHLKDFDQYTTTHALNVSVLAMGLAEELGMPASQVRGFGISGLLHDLGKIRIPKEILNKPGALTDAEREIMQGHTVEGAKLILSHDADLDLAAIVAYEHHRRRDGGGYPQPKVPRPCHHASDLVHVCDVYDALRTHRPYRDAWEHERVIGYLEEAAGEEFDPVMVQAFVRMTRRATEAPGRIEAVSSPPE